MSIDTRQKAVNEIFDFFNKSTDFNGIPLTSLSKKNGVEYCEILQIVKDLVIENMISLQNDINPHIIRARHHNIEDQLEMLEAAVDNEIKEIDVKSSAIKVTWETYMLCAYPSPSYLNQNPVSKNYDLKPFTKRLSLGETQLTPVFFEIDVLERYFADPRYVFEFDDYSGQISIVDEVGLREHDQVFLQSFGLGYDEEGTRVAVAYLTYLNDLSAEHQAYWNSKRLDISCEMVEEYYKNTMLGEWVMSQSLFSATIEEHRVLNEMSELIENKPLFRETFEDHKRPKEFTFFTTPTLVHYESFISLLDKMISDNINKKFFDDIDHFILETGDDGVIEKKPKGTLTLLDEWLKKFYKLQNEEDYKLLTKPFKCVRKERQNPAHRISENRYDPAYFKKQMDILLEVYDGLKTLRQIFHMHPRVRAYEVPEWLEKSEVKLF